MKPFQRYGPPALLALISAYGTAVVWSAFRAGRFAYHDVTLIAGFLANAAYGRGVFWASDEAFNHLTIHFTPSLLLVVPFFRLFDSQFVLLAIGAAAIAATAFAVLALFRQWCAHGLAPWFFVVLAGWGYFSKTLLYSAHFELLYMPFAALAFLLCLRGARVEWVVAAAIVALGVRQDAGLYLFFQFASLPLLRVIRPAKAPRFRRTVVIVCALSAIYTALAIKVFMPLCHAPPGRYVEQWWGHYGSTWGGVGWGMATHPWRVVRDTFVSGWPILTLELALLPVLSSRSYLVSSLPGLLLFTASAHAKSQLDYYNGAFLFPCALLCAADGLLVLVRHAQGAREPVVRFGLAAIGLVTLIRTDHRGGAATAFWDFGPPAEARTVIEEAIAQCPSARSVAADFNAVVFVPNHLEAYMLRHSEKADIVVRPGERATCVTDK